MSQFYQTKKKLEQFFSTRNKPKLCSFFSFDAIVTKPDVFRAPCTQLFSEKNNADATVRCTLQGTSPHNKTPQPEQENFSFFFWANDVIRIASTIFNEQVFVCI